MYVTTVKLVKLLKPVGGYISGWIQKFDYVILFLKVEKSVTNIFVISKW